MKKVGLLIMLVVVGFLGYKGYSYYNDTYKATEAYAVIPNDIPEKKEALDMSGKQIKESDGTLHYSYDYSLNFVKKNGQKQVQEYSVTAPKPVPFEPGTYVKAEISNKRVVKGPYTVAEKDIPKEILEKLK